MRQLTVNVRMLLGRKEAICNLQSRRNGTSLGSID